MDTITEIHENVYEFLDDYRNTKIQVGELFTTFRRINNEQRLEKGYWYHGSDFYVAISFWSGNDWKNKTPNIYLRINEEGNTSLEMTAKDSIYKSELIQKFFIKQLSLITNGKDRWIKHYKTNQDYITSLTNFLVNDKIVIDDIIKTNLSQFYNGDDTKNNIGFIDKRDYSHWLKNIQKYREKKFYNNLPFAITSFNIQNFGLIRHLDFGIISHHSPFIFLVGENGGGKSTILKAIAIAVGNKFFDENFVPYNSPWIINFSIKQNGRKKSLKLNIEDSTFKTAKAIPFAAYGASRLSVNSIIKPKGKDEDSKKTHPYYSLFFNDGLLLDFNRWLLMELGKVKQTEEEKIRTRLKYENIKQILVTIIPDLYDIRETEFDGTLLTPQLLYFEEDYNGEKITRGVTFENLSSGIKSLVALIGDMLVRLFNQQPDIIDPSELSGIVLIDEIDIHLHPKLQKKIPQILFENFPKVQFIVSTHSPIPLLGAPKNSKIYNIFKDYELGISVKSLNYLNINNLLPNTILTSPVFGMDDLISINNNDETQINVDDSFSDTEFFELLDKKMDELNKREKILGNKYFK